MNWQDLSSNQKLGLAAAAIFGFGYLTGGTATVVRHRRALSRAAKDYKLNAGKFSHAWNALSRMKDASRKLKKAEGRGRLGRALFGSEVSWMERLSEARGGLRMAVDELRARADTFSGAQIRQFEKLKKATGEAYPGYYSSIFGEAWQGREDRALLEVR